MIFATFFQNFWEKTGVKRILQNECHIGVLVCHKSYTSKINYIRKELPEQEHFRHENAVPVIVPTSSICPVSYVILKFHDKCCAHRPEHVTLTRDNKKGRSMRYLFFDNIIYTIFVIIIVAQINQEVSWFYIIIFRKQFFIVICNSRIFYGFYSVYIYSYAAKVLGSQRYFSIVFYVSPVIIYLPLSFQIPVHFGV